MGLAVKKEIESIEEMEEDCYSRANTPVDFKLSHNIDPSVESGYIPTPRETQREPFPMASSLEKSSPRTPPLTRPPSLIEQQEEDSEEDVLNSIKLATNSKFSSEPKSKINRLSQSIELDP